jgi:hypothetical protein
MKMVQEIPGRYPGRRFMGALLRFQDSDSPVSVDDAMKSARSRNGARVLLFQMEAEGLLLRAGHGRYYPASPQVALLSGTLPPYYRTLWRAHDALERGGLPHAFACLTTMMHADYSPGRPIIAMSAETLMRLEGSDVFGLMPVGKGLRDLSNRVALEWPDGSKAFDAPALRWDWTALVLGAIGLPREIAAARRLIEGKEIGARLACRLNAFGLSPWPGLLEKEVSVIAPADVKGMRRRYAETLLLEQVRGAGSDGRA